MAAAAPLEDPAACALVGALQGLHRAFQKLAMYPSGHPSVPEAIQLATSRFTEALAGGNWVVVRVTRTDLIWNGERISDGAETLRSLAGLLHDLDLAALEFRVGLQGRELETFVHLLAEARRDSVSGAALVDAMQATRVESIRLCAIDYRALSIADGVQQGSGGSENMWEHLSEVLTDPETFSRDMPVQELADEVAQQVQSLEETGVSELRGELHRQMQKSNSLAVEQSKVFRRRMGDFVAALNPDLRRNLLQVGSMRTRESLSLMNDLSESIPPSEILDALQNVDQVGGGAHDELVQLLQKMVSISRDRPAVQGQLEDTLNRWGVSSTVLQETGRLGEAVEEVFQRRTEDNYNPSEYKCLLGDLTSGVLSGSIPRSAELYGDPSNEDAMRAHCAEIAVQLLGRSDGDEHRPALFGYVGTHADGLLKRGDLVTVVHAVVAARADRALKQDNEDVTKAAGGFLGDFRGESRIELILSALSETQPLSMEARALLELGGVPALDAVLDRLSREFDPVFAGSLREFCAAQNSTAWTDVLARRAPGGWPLLEPTFPALRQMQTGSAVPLLLKLFEHESSRVRREALILLCEINAAAGGSHIALALRDESLRVVNTGLRRITALAQPDAVALLGSFATGRTPGSWFSQESFNLSLSLLLSQGQPGLEELCRALDHARSSLTPLGARRGRRMAEALAPYRNDSGTVRKSLGRWRRSPARLLSNVLPKLQQHQGASDG